MELILKIPPNKPPFIGILFSSEYEASKLNQSLVDLNLPFKCVLLLEPKDARKTDVTLKASEGVFTYKYAGLTYNKDKLKLFLDKTSGSRLYNFSHLVIKNNVHQVVKTITSRQYFILKVRSIEFLQEQY